MRYSADWHEDAPNAADEERASVADLRLHIGDINVTQHLLNGSVSDHVTVALYGLAHGISHDWWTIFGSRDREFSLLKYRSGFVLPDIRVQFDGDVFELEARQRAFRDPDIRFWGGSQEVMSRSDGEAFLAGIVEDVLGRLNACGVGATSAAARWKRVLASRGSAEAPFCEAAGALGLDPYDIGDEAGSFLEGAERLFQGEPLIEFVAGSSGVKKGDLLRWVQRMTKHQGAQFRVRELREIVEQVDRNTPRRPHDEPWAIGYRRARAVRRVLALATSRTFSSFQEVAQLFAASRAYNLAPKVDGIRALRSEAIEGSMQIHLRNHGDSAEAQSAHLFAMARAIGDAACYPEAKLASINDLHHASRQAAGRAFAAEFLAPVDEIRCMRADQHDLVTIADHFSVSAAVIERQIENESRIMRACA